MLLRRLSFACVVALVCVPLLGCSGVIDPSKNTIETFEGDVPVGGAYVTNYSWSKNGEIEVTMTTVTPTPTRGPLRMYIGQDSGGNCFQLVGYDTQAIVNLKVQFGVINKGNYCFGVYDNGVLTVPAHVKGTFSHP